jgi:hypothetical protein
MRWSARRVQKLAKRPPHTEQQEIHPLGAWHWRVFRIHLARGCTPKFRGAGISAIEYALVAYSMRVAAGFGWQPLLNTKWARLSR